MATRTSIGVALSIALCSLHGVAFAQGSDAGDWFGRSDTRFDAPALENLPPQGKRYNPWAGPTRTAQPLVTEATTAQDYRGAYGQRTWSNLSRKSEEREVFPPSRWNTNGSQRTGSNLPANATGTPPTDDGTAAGAAPFAGSGYGASGFMPNLYESGAIYPLGLGGEGLGPWPPGGW